MQGIQEFTNQTFHLCDQLRKKAKYIIFTEKKRIHAVIIFPFNSSKFFFSPFLHHSHINRHVSAVPALPKKWDAEMLLPLLAPDATWVWHFGIRLG